MSRSNPLAAIVRELDRAGIPHMLILRKERAFSRSEFERRELATIDETQVFVATAEDTIVAKLEWARAGGRRDSFGMWRASSSYAVQISTWPMSSDGLQSSACWWSGSGRKPRQVDRPRRAVDIPGLYVNISVKLHPTFDSLRSKPRFDAVLAGMNLAD